MRATSRRSGIAVLAVTRQGTILGAEIAASLASAQETVSADGDVSLHVKSEWLSVAPAGALPLDSTLRDRVAELFPRVESFVFVLAAGAAIRLVAPLLGAKQDDPGVICVDDDGRYVIPLLGGHQADANRLAQRIADAIGGTAVVTTASETAGLPNLDRLGLSERWRIEATPEALKLASTALLAGADPLVYEQSTISGSRSEIPSSWQRAQSLEQLRGWPGPRIAVADSLLDPDLAADGGPLLVYRPRTLVVGVGCSTDAPPDEVEALVCTALSEARLSFASIARIATIDRRSMHPAITHLAVCADAVCDGFSADDLASVADAPNPSSEVQRHVGTPGVCEPAAILASGGGTLLVPKQKSAHATVAVARLARAASRPGRLWLVGMGPGPLDLMTPRARTAIRSADLVVGYRGYLDMLAPLVSESRLRRYELGQERERAAEAIERARDGNRVALVSSGDVGIYGMAGLVFELLADEGRTGVAGSRRTAGAEPSVEVVPGVTAASSAAAILGAPLMLDFAAISLSDLLVPWSSIRRRLLAAAEGDLVVVLYNPASARRRQPFEEALAILRQHRDPDTPVGIVRDAYRPGQSVIVMSLRELTVGHVDMLSVVVVGCSRTETLDGWMVTRRGYLERDPR
ncbi:MAG: precorrin-3B C(17)-methyltransferase [Chloroflexota bacterium]